MKKLLLAVVVFVACLPSVSLAQNVAISTADDQTAMEVTVYNSNVGLVKDTRRIRLSRGKENELRFMDVAAQIMPVTVHAKSLSAPQKFTVLEQNYEYDLIDSNKLLDKYVGKKIKLMENNQYQNSKNVVDATLLSNNNSPIYKIGDEIYLNYPGYTILPEIPEDLIAKPTLMWMYENTGTSHDLQVSYLTKNIKWKADYVLVLDQADKKGDLSGWVTVNNKSGAGYNNAKLKLVAGDVNRVQQDAQRRPLYAQPMMMKQEAIGKGFQQKEFFEYHIYDLQRKTDIKNNQTKQINLLEANDFNVTKELLVYGNQGYYSRQYREEIPKQEVKVFVKFKNEKQNKLGMPLPAGIIRLYKEDDQGSLQFIGEDRIDHTPKDEEVRVKVGEAFDVVCERKQTDYKKIARNVYEVEWETTIRNHKKKDVVVGLVEPIGGDWTMIYNSHQYEKTGSFTARFDVKVPKDGETVVKYRVRVNY